MTPTQQPDAAESDADEAMIDANDATGDKCPGRCPTTSQRQQQRLTGPGPEVDSAFAFPLPVTLFASRGEG